jgi:hypothetical protein
MYLHLEEWKTKHKLRESRIDFYSCRDSSLDPSPESQLQQTAHPSIQSVSGERIEQPAKSVSVQMPIGNNCKRCLDSVDESY